MKKFKKAFVVSIFLCFVCSAALAKNYEVETWINPKVNLSNDKILYYVDVNDFILKSEAPKPVNVAYDELVDFIPKVFYKKKVKCKPYGVHKFDVLVSDAIRAKKGNERGTEVVREAKKHGYKYLLFYDVGSEMRNVTYQATSIPYTSYENAYVHGYGESATISVPQQNYINIPERVVPFLVAQIEARLYEINDDFIWSNDYLDKMYVASSVYFRSREYQGGKIMNVINEGINVVTGELFAPKEK